MNVRKLSVNKACIFFAVLLLVAMGTVSAALYGLTQNITAVWYVLLFGIFVLVCAVCFMVLVRRKLAIFSDAFCSLMDDMLSGNMQPKQTVEEESLFYKIKYRLNRLYEVMQENKNGIAQERADLQELISDISHQVKTPIANLKMINNTLLENEVPPQKQKEFLTAQASQLDKLDFLMQAMIKTSRLETGVISLEQKQQPVYDTLAAALGGILLNAEKKQIDVQVECPEHLDARHDRKWTSEALFNILDNAVKYTPAGGTIRIYGDGATVVIAQQYGAGNRETLSRVVHTPPVLSLPPRAELTSLRVGVDEGATITPMENPFRHKIVIFGSSFTHGVSTSRAGMSYPMQIGRNTGLYFCSIACSGNCKLQPYFADYLGDVKDADAMVFDAFSNPDAKMIEERLIPFIERIRAKLPSTPLIFVQTIYRESGNFDLRSRKIEEDKRDMARRQMAEAMKRFDNVYFVDKADLTGTDHVTSADGTHPSDLGYWRWAQNLQPELLKVFRKCGIR